MSSAGDIILLGTCLTLQVLGRGEHQFSMSYDSPAEMCYISYTNTLLVATKTVGTSTISNLKSIMINEYINLI